MESKHSKLALLLFVALLFATLLKAQNVLHVNPAFNDGVSSFSDLQAAIDAASEGDEIRVYPGGYQGTTTVDKRLNIIGRGYNIVENFPNVNTNLNDARVARLEIEESAAGSLIQGLQVFRLLVKGADNCVIDQNFIGGMVVYDATTVIIKRNYFDDSAGGAVPPSLIPGCSGSSTNLSLLTSSVGNLVVKNNIFVRTVGNSSSFRSWQDVDCGGRNHSSSVDFQFNYTNRTIIPPATSIYLANNQYNTDQGSLLNFTQYGQVTRNVLRLPGPPGNINVQNFNTELVLGNNSFDGRHQLLPNAQSRGYATDGGDVGPFGGASPYKLSGVTALPFIYELNVPEEATTSAGININVKVKTEND